MINKFKFLKVCSMFGLLGVFNVNTQAATIWLQPAGNSDTSPGGMVTYELWADAADVGGFLAGGLDVFYDENVLTYSGDFAFDAGFPTDPAFSLTGSDCSLPPTLPANCSAAGEINAIAFGDFGGIASSGPTLVGSLSFTGTIPGVSLLTLADNDLPAGMWFDVNGNPLTVDYTGAQITVVPLPAAAWLMASGVGMLMGLGSKRARQGSVA